jgi:ribosomal protein L2
MEYDPNRSGELLLIRSMSTNELSYIIRPVGVEVGSKIYSFPRGVHADTTLAKTTLVQPGNCLPLKVYFFCILILPWSCFNRP